MKLIHYLTKGILSIEEYFIVVAFSTPVAVLVNKYLFNDWEFASFLLTLVLIDTGLGIWGAIAKSDLSSKKFSGFFTKIILYFIFLCVIHIATNFTANGEKVSLLSWMDIFGYTALIVRESLSILEKLARIDSKLLPSWIAKRLRDFDDDGELNGSAT
jgi:phage-related holin